MKIEIENYITRNYYELLKISKKYTKDDDWAQELLHEVILQLYDAKSFNENNKLDDKSIRFYIVRIIHVNWCYPTSPFYRKYKKPTMSNVDLTEAMGVIYEENEMEEHSMMDLIEIEWAELDWFRKDIFNRYLTLGSLKKVSKNTTIPLTSIARYVNTAKQDIKANILSKINE